MNLTHQAFIIEFATWIILFERYNIEQHKYRIKENDIWQIVMSCEWHLENIASIHLRKCILKSTPTHGKRFWNKYGWYSNIIVHFYSYSPINIFLQCVIYFLFLSLSLSTSITISFVLFDQISLSFFLGVYSIVK